MYTLNAINIARDIDLDKAKKAIDIEVYLKKRKSLILKRKGSGLIFVYFFGAVVFFDVPDEEQKKVIGKITKHAVKVGEEKTSESYEIAIGKHDNIDFDKAVIDRFSTKKIEIIAYVLAQSAAIERLEIIVDKRLEKIEELNNFLKTGGRLHLKSKEILKLIGENSDIIRETIANLSMLDEPDMVWDHKELENLFGNCRKMFALDTRFKNLKFKVDYIQNNLKIITDILNTRRLEFLELAIIVLIIIEILIYIYEVMH